MAKQSFYEREHNRGQSDASEDKDKSPPFWGIFQDDHTRAANDAYNQGYDSTQAQIEENEEKK